MTTSLSTPERLFENALDPRRGSGHRVRDRVVRAWRRTWARLVRLGGISDGNHVQVFFDGDEVFGAMYQALEQAQKRIWLETYIYEDDRVGQTIERLLRDAVARGCEVVVLYDMWGSQDLRDDFFHELDDAGAEVIAFNPVELLPRWSVAGWFRKVRQRGKGRMLATKLVRDHRKVLVVDDEVAFTGGMNISEDYAGPKLGKDTFRDSHARLEGPCVADVADIFYESWRLATHHARPRIRRIHKEHHDEGALVQVLRSNVLLNRTQIQRALRQIIQRSLERCWLTTPYFVPPRRLIRQLMRAARRGVDVRVLTAGKSDVPMVRMASEHLYGRLLRKGIKVYEMHTKTLHAKTAVVDGLYSTVGSFNLDTWSFKRNLEVNVSVVDPALAHCMERQFEKDLELAELVELSAWERRGLLTRLLNWLAYQLARI